VTAQAALRRLLPTLLRLRGPARTRAHRSRAGIGSARPVRRSTSCRHSTDAPSLSRSFGRPSLDFRSSSEFITGNPCRPRRLPGWVDDTASPGLCLPYDTIPGRWIRLPAADPSATATPRAGFGYPLRGYYLRPSRHLRVGASMGFTLQGLPFAAIGTPLGAPALLPLPAASAPPRGVAPQQRGRLQGLVPATNPFSHRDHEDPSRRYLLGFRPSRACPHPTWRSLLSRRLPSRPRAA